MGINSINTLIDKIGISAQYYPKRIFDHSGKIYTCINPYSYLVVKNNAINLEDFDGIFVDGISMCLWIKAIWHKKIPRLSFDMTSIAKDLFERCSSTHETLYFIGSKEDQITKSIKTIKESYPNLDIIGFRNGYFKDGEDRRETINKIISLNPNFVIAGMGTPSQENFLIDLKKSGYKGIAFTCGGFLHQTAEGINYYPEWVNKYNLRGFYRQYKEKGIFKRNYETFILFPITFLIDTLKYKFKKK